jgi:hypothetical protein
MRYFLASLSGTGSSAGVFGSSWDFVYDGNNTVIVLEFIDNDKR